jgi:hypothetical protein
LVYAGWGITAVRMGYHSAEAATQDSLGVCRT